MTEDNVTSDVNESLPPEAELGDQQTPPERDDAAKLREKPWFQKVIDRQTREKWEARRETEQVKAQALAIQTELEAIKAGKPVTGTREPTIQEIDTRASAILAQKEFDKACNDAYDKGTEVFEDFKDILEETFRAMPLPVDALQVITNLKNPHEILYELAKNPEKLEKILSLPPEKRAVELTRLEIAKVNKVAVSKVAPPIKTVDARRGSGGVDIYDPSTSTEDWMKMRREQKSKRKA